MEQNTEKKSIKVIVWIIIGAVCAVLLYVGFSRVMPYVTGSIFQGKWDCGAQIVELNKDNTFAMYAKESKNTLNVIGTYEFERDEKNVLKYDITMKTTDRTIGGEKYTNEFTNKYQIVVEENSKYMGMVNLNTNNMYTCKKIK